MSEALFMIGGYMVYWGLWMFGIGSVLALIGVLSHFAGRML